MLISLNAYSEEVVMVFGQSLPPYIIENSNSGAELSIVKEALALEGHQLVPVYTELALVEHMFDQNKVDAAHRYIHQSKDKSDLYYGNVTLGYHDVFFTLVDRNINISTPSDLNNYTLLSFQDAQKHYPKWLPENYEHSQTSAQINQIKLLQLGLIDIVLSDKYIFSYYCELYRSSANGIVKDMRMHVFTPPFKYNPVFKSKKIALAFNQGLKKLKETGRYTEIISNKLKLDSAIKDQVDLTL
jgi:polar amino acid transport system substrate-binding protein